MEDHDTCVCIFGELIDRLWQGSGYRATGAKYSPLRTLSPWEALRATKTSPSIFATFEKANTCAKELFVRRNPVKIEQTCKGKILLKKSC